MTKLMLARILAIILRLFGRLCIRAWTFVVPLVLLLPIFASVLGRSVELSIMSFAVFGLLYSILESVREKL